MRIAIVHEWLTLYGGAERITEQIFELFPDADLFSLVDFLPEKDRHFVRGKVANTSFIQQLPFARKHFRKYLGLWPMAIQQLDLRAYDLIISVSFAVSHAVITGPDQLHINICCSPARYAWDLQEEYLQEVGMATGVKSWIARSILHGLRTWDASTGTLPDQVVAISQFIQRRIRKVWGQESVILYPPVDTTGFSLSETRQDYYLTASRHVAYKHVNTVVEAFRGMPERKLVVIGDGPEHARIQETARGCANIEILGHVSFADLKSHMQNCRAFIFAAKEDFGIAPVEAQACGAPVIAFGEGGAAETIIGDPSAPNRSGLFFYQQNAAAIAEAVRVFETQDVPRPADCRASALRFSADSFREQLVSLIDTQVAKFEAQLGRPFRT